MLCMECARHIDERCQECSYYTSRYTHSHNLAKTIEAFRKNKKKIDLSDQDWQFIINMLKEF